MHEGERVGKRDKTCLCKRLFIGNIIKEAWMRRLEICDPYSYSLFTCPTQIDNIPAETIPLDSISVSFVDGAQRLFFYLIETKYSARTSAAAGRSFYCRRWI